MLPLKNQTRNLLPLRSVPRTLEKQPEFTNLRPPSRGLDYVFERKRQGGLDEGQGISPGCHFYEDEGPGDDFPDGLLCGCCITICGVARGPQECSVGPAELTDVYITYISGFRLEWFAECGQLKKVYIEGVVSLPGPGTIQQQQQEQRMKNQSEKRGHDDREATKPAPFPLWRLHSARLCTFRQLP